MNCPPVIYFAESRNCEALRTDLYRDLSRLLSRSYTVKTLPGPGFKHLNDLSIDSIKPNCSALIIGGPRELLTDEDINNIQRYFMRGGNVLYLAPYSGSYDVTTATGDATETEAQEESEICSMYDPAVASVTEYNVSALTNGVVEYSGTHTIMSSVFHQELLHPRNALINNCTLPGFTARLLELRRCSRILSSSGQSDQVGNEQHNIGNEINYDFDVFSRSTFVEALNSKTGAISGSGEQDIVLHLTAAALTSASNSVNGKADTNINVVVPHASSFTINNQQGGINNSNGNSVAQQNSTMPNQGKLYPITLIASGDTCIPTNQPIVVAVVNTDTRNNMGGVILFTASTLIFSNLWLSKMDNQYLALTLFEHIFGLNEMVLGPVRQQSSQNNAKDTTQKILFKPQTKFLMTLSNQDIVKTSLEITDRYVLLPNIVNTSSRLRACLHNPDILPDDFRMLLTTSAQIDLPTMSSISSTTSGGSANIIQNMPGNYGMGSESSHKDLQALVDGELNSMDSPADIKRVLLPHILELYKKLNIPNCDKEPNLKMVMPNFERSMPSLQTAVHMPGLPNPIGEPQLELFDLDAEFASPTVKLQKMTCLAQKAHARKVQKAIAENDLSEDAAKASVGGITEEEFINLVRQVGEIVGIKPKAGSKAVEAKSILSEMLRTVVEFKKSSFQDPKTEIAFN